MKLLSLELKNYKCHAHTLLSDIGSFRCVIGANGTGKTSILEISQFLKQTAESVGSATEIVTGKVQDNEFKAIEVLLILELTKREQEKFRRKLARDNFENLVPMETVSLCSLEPNLITFSCSRRKRIKTEETTKVTSLGLSWSQECSFCVVSFVRLLHSVIHG